MGIHNFLNLIKHKKQMFGGGFPFGDFEGMGGGGFPGHPGR